MPKLALRHLVVLIVVVTVGTAIGLHDLAAYRALRTSAVEVASGRLRAAAGQIGQILDAQSAQLRGQLDSVARHPAVTAVLRSPANATARTAALSTLGTLTFVPTAPAAMEIVDSAGMTVVSTAARSPVPENTRRDALALVSSGRSVAVGKGVTVGDTLFYPIVARVAVDASTLGYVVQWRRLTSNEGARKQLITLIGPGTDIAVGNTTGPGWTDLAHVIPRPPLALPTEGATWYKRDGVGNRLAVARPIGGTAWTLVVDFTERTVMSEVDALMRRFVLVTVLLLAGAMITAWLLARRLTTPLGALADAAAGIRAGDYSRRVIEQGPGEVRTLGAAFNSMSASIDSAHRTLHERSAELDASLAGAPVGIAVHDTDSRYRRVNTSLAALHGSSPEGHTGRLPSELVPGAGAIIENNIRAVISTAESRSNIEISAETPARPGVTQYWLASFYPIQTAAGQLIGAGSVVADLTAYKRLESQLVQSQKMEAVGRLAGGVAHDFNNILTAISGFARFALSSLDEGHPGARADLEQVLAAADRAASLTGQLLAFSRQQVLQPRVIDLNTIVNGLSPMLARLIGEHVKLVAKPAPTLSAIRADPSQVEQVLVNLVVNARDAMPNGGTLTIETSDVALDAAYAATREGVTPGRYVMLAVTDSGVGMDAATRARVFDPFFTTKEAGKGTGLGLATVYGIVKQSGGHVDVYSEPGRGSTFKIYMPWTGERVDDRVTPVAVPAVKVRERLTVLLVDDDPLVSAAARRSLERAGYQVLAASGGRQALGLVERHDTPIEILVTDLVMPEMGGRELARRVASARPSVRVLYTSGYTAEAMNQQAVLEPGDAFLGKPFTPDSLLRAVDALIEAV